MFFFRMVLVRHTEQAISSVGQSDFTDSSLCNNHAYVANLLMQNSKLLSIISTIKPHYNIRNRVEMYMCNLGAMLQNSCYP